MYAVKNYLCLMAPQIPTTAISDYLSRERFDILMTGAAHLVACSQVAEDKQ